MNIVKTTENSRLTFAVEGRLDTTTAPEFEKAANEIPEEITELTIDAEKLEYVSSAGLRVFLMIQKKMNAQGKMIVKNLTESVREVFDITGFSDIINIE